MTKSQFLRAITESVNALPRGSRLDLHVAAGMKTTEVECGFTEAEPNGTFTLTVRVNGGAKTTEGESYAMRAMREMDRKRG